MQKEVKPSKISIIVPAYNAVASLGYSVNSALSQDYKNIEIIIVNDGSTDETSKIAHEIERKNKNVKVIDKENRGLGEARNSGVLVASGEYIIFLDSDDMLLPWSVSSMYSIAEKESADIVCGAMLETSHPTKEYNRLIEEKPSPVAKRLKDGFEDLLYMKVVPSAHAKLYRASLIRDEKFSKIRHAEDLEYNLRMFRKAKNICALESPVIEIYALTSGSMMRSAYNSKKHEEISILQDLEKDYNKTKNDDYRKAYAAGIFFHSIGLARLIFADDEAKKKYAEDYKLLRSYIKKYSRSVFGNKKALKTQRRYAFVASLSVSALFFLMRLIERKNQ